MKAHNGLAVAGLPQEWHAPLAARLAEVSAPIPVRLLDPDAGDAVDPGAHGALLWLGDAHSGARALSDVRTLRPDAPFWLGPQGGDPVFVALATVQGPVYWATWAGAQYNAVSQPAAWLTFEAACAALEGMSGRSSPPQARLLHSYRITQGGESVPLDHEAGGR